MNSQEVVITKYREEAENWGKTAIIALEQGDAGSSRSAARQAAKYARMALMLEGYHEINVETPGIAGDSASQQRSCH